jgi:predicted pyridoxine 5'-phosphate oxidase superfamily flavin-nucleotide-binding protein
MQRVVLEQRLGFHATVRPDGTPNLSPKGTTTVWDDDHLLFADIRSPDTIANLRRNPAIEVNVVDPILRKGWRFRGRAELHDRGETYDRGLALLAARGYEAMPGRMTTIALIRVEEAKPLVSPAYDGGASEAEVRAQSLRRLGVVPGLMLPPGFEPPAGLEHERFRLRRLSVGDVDADFEAIRERVAPDGAMRGSPRLTREQNLIDLGWHEKEFQLGRSFAYTVVAPDESRVLGCVYVSPDDQADAQVRLWVRRDAWDSGLDPVLERAVRDWIDGNWPFGNVRWPEREQEGPAGRIT